MAEIKLAGIWLRSLGHVSAVKWSSRWGTGPCGSDVASCAVAVSPTSDSPLLRINQPFEVWEDGVQVFGGVTSDPGSGFPWTLNAKGWARRVADFQAVDSSGNPTANVQTAATQIIANGAPLSNPSAFPNVTIGVDGDVPSMQGADGLFDTWGATTGNRWGADVSGVLFTATDETEPSYYLDASDLPIGVASDGLFTRVRARYVTSVTDGTADGWDSVVADDAAAQDQFEVIEYPMDLTSLGLLTGGGTTAQAYADQQLAALTIPQWTSRMTTNADRLLTPGGQPAHLRSVRAGQVVRLFNVPNTLGGLRNELALDVVLGEVEFDTENPREITLAPVNLAVRNVADMAQQAAKAAKAAGVA